MYPTRIPAAARQAIIQGVYADHPLSNLELLGLSTRILDRLANSRFQVVTLEDLVCLSRDDILSIQSLGDKSLESILGCLARYNELTCPSGILDHITEGTESLAAQLAHP
jgi:DNA-directed RNA polymerase alpha subunit